MRGDVIVLEDYHIKAGKRIVQHILDDVNAINRCYVITVGGESGSGKSEMGKAIKDEFLKEGCKSIVLGQDDYFVLPPRSNDAKRREDSCWLGPHVEVKIDVLEKNIMEAIHGKEVIRKPLIDYEKDKILEEEVNLEGVKVLIAEGTYTSLLRNVDKRIFIDRNFQDTLAHRSKRNRGDEVGDPFIDRILKVEHQIIAGHKNLADIIITSDYEVVFSEKLVK